MPAAACVRARSLSACDAAASRRPSPRFVRASFALRSPPREPPRRPLCDARTGPRGRRKRADYSCRRAPGGGDRPRRPRADSPLVSSP